MNWLSRTLAHVRNTVQPHARPVRSRRRLSLEMLEDRSVPSAASSVAFTDSSVLRAATINAANQTFDLWYNAANALALGVSQVNVNTGHGNTTTTNYLPSTR